MLKKLAYFRFLVDQIFFFNIKDMDACFPLFKKVNFLKYKLHINKIYILVVYMNDV